MVKKVTRRDTRRGGQEWKENNLDHRREGRTPEEGVLSVVVVRKEIVIVMVAAPDVK